jgi:hypothetical protein
MKDGVESLGRIRARGITLLLITFGVGVLAGFAVERVLAARSSPEPFFPGPGMGGPFAGDVMPPPFERLDLTPDQQSQIAEIMREARPRTDAVLNEFMPHLRAVSDSVRSEIRSVLTEDQLAAWDSMTVEMRSRRGTMRRGMRPGPPPMDPGGGRR